MSNFTTYGKQLCKDTDDAAALAQQVGDSTGATAHMRATATDTRIVVLLTGKDFQGRNIRRTAHSVAGAHFTAQAIRGLRLAWHVRSDGSRKLVFTC